MYNEDIKNKKVCVLGAGYVGLMFGLTLTYFGYKFIIIKK